MAKKKELVEEVEIVEPCSVWINGSEYKIAAGKQVLPEMVENVLRNAGKL